MKKYILSAIAVVGALAMTSCSDFLQPQAEGNPTTDSYFTNDQQAIDAVDAVYAAMTNGDDYFGREYQWMNYATTDGVIGKTKGWSNVLALQFEGNSEKEPLGSVFNEAMNFISRSNYVVYSLKKKAMTTTLTDVEKRSLGEALFLRAFNHFVIAFRYGLDTQGVPFIKYENEEDPTTMIPTQQATVMDDYKMIIEDLEEAATYLPTIDEYDSSNKGRVHAAAAIGLEAKVYAFWAAWDASQWNNVITVVNKLESQYGRALVADYNDLFTSDTSKWGNSEELYCIYCNGGDGSSCKPGGTEFPGVCLENQGWGIYNGWGQGKPSYDIYEELSKDDANLIDASKGNVRKVRSVLEYGQEFPFLGQTRRYYSTTDIEAGFMINKFMEPFGHGTDAADAAKQGYVSSNGDYPTCRIVYPILRFADCLLLRAEAKIMTGQDGSSDINLVRNRANVKSLDHVATMADIYHERRVELAFEACDRFQDLRRWTLSSDATIKNLALTELNAKPRIRKYEDRSDPDSPFTIEYYGDYAANKTGNDWSSEKIVFPYPTAQVEKANGALKQNPGY